MNIVDTHCHLDNDIFDVDRLDVIKNCLQIGVHKIFIPAVQASGWDNLLALCEQHAGLYPMLGLHPMFIAQHKDADLVALETYLAKYSPCAVGEIGLDFFSKKNDTKKQIRYFSTQLDIAKCFNLPVILHVRKAHQQVLNILKQKKVRSGIVHAFSGSKEEAQRYIDLGFKLGFGGMITYSRSKKLQQLAIDLPLSAIVLETDSPDMTGQQHHGQRNSPEYLPECLTALSYLRQQPIDDIAKITTLNAMQIFETSVNGT